MKTLKEGIALDIESNNEIFFIDKLCLIEQVLDVYYKYVNDDLEDNIANLFDEILKAYQLSEKLCKTIMSIPDIKQDIKQRKELKAKLDDILKVIKRHAAKIPNGNTQKEVLGELQNIHALHFSYNDINADYINRADEESLELAEKNIDFIKNILNNKAESINVCQEYLETPMTEYYGFIRSEFNNNFIFGSYLQKDFLGNLLSLKAKLFSNTIEFLQEASKILINNINDNKYPILSEDYINKIYLLADCSNSIDTNITRLINIIRSNEVINKSSIYTDINSLINKTNAALIYVRDGVKNEEILKDDMMSYQRKLKYRYDKEKNQ
ncbi:MAG: hypothetical protein IJO33_04365 [Bacilli bacterium]|nr:hypothetical protein [Bacilli bacterium]